MTATSSQTTEDNRRIVTAAYAALAEGDSRPFAAAMAEDFVWHMIGTTAWSGTFAGRKAVREQLMRPLFAQFASTYRNRASRILADGDHVVVECRGEVETRGGQPYCNTYCLVIRLEGGLMRELTEYLDTALVDRMLLPPDRQAAPA